jgi:hypothetical protein
MEILRPSGKQKVAGREIRRGKGFNGVKACQDGI